MKKILLLLLLILPLKVDALVKTHLIDAEIEIAGALKVKELIVLDGKETNLKRSINYKSVLGTWDKKVSLDLNPMYNGYSIENINVSALSLDEMPDFNYEIENYFDEIKPGEKKDNYYVKTNSDYGFNINISYDGKESEYTAFYIEYLVTNVIVSHNDINELYYTFKDLNYSAEETLIRMILPYETDSELFKVWMRGPSTGELNTLSRNGEDSIGAVAFFPNLNSDITVRLTMPKEHVGIDIYLNKTETDVFDDIVSLENSNMNKLGNTLLLMKYIIMFISIFYVLGVIFLYKYSSKGIYIGYLILGIVIIFFNYLFKFNIIPIYFIPVAPLAIIFIKKLKK